MKEKMEQALQRIKQSLHRMDLEIKRHTDFNGAKPMMEFLSVYKEMIKDVETMVKLLERASDVGLPKGALSPEDVAGVKLTLEKLQHTVRELESRVTGGVPTKAVSKSRAPKPATEGPAQPV